MADESKGRRLLIKAEYDRIWRKPGAGEEGRSDP